jgi:hypothetical protein
MKLAWLGYAGIILPVLGATYGGLMIASDLEQKLDAAYDMSQDAHDRIGEVHMQIDMLKQGAEFAGKEDDRELKDAVERIEMSLYNITRQLQEVSGRLALVDGVMSGLEKKSYDNVSFTQLDGIREQIFSVRDSVNELKMDTGPDPMQEIMNLRREMEDLRRMMDEHHSGNWN